MTVEPGEARELVGQAVTNPLKHTSPEAQSSHLVLTNLKPGLQIQALLLLEPCGDVKFAGHAMIKSLFPPGQYDPLVQIGQGLVPDLEPLPKYPGAHRHWFWDVESAGLRVLLGHALFAPAMHQELMGHEGQVDPLR
jgi:hypothetical protein